MDANVDEDAVRKDSDLGCNYSDVGGIQSGVVRISLEISFLE